MPSWREVRETISRSEKPSNRAHDAYRNKYLKMLHKHTRRNIILYYSGWLQYPEETHLNAFDLNDMDISGFMSTIHKLDRAQGLDLFLHTPGGGIAATEALVAYLRQMFGTNIRAIVPQLALSAGTMTALACREVVMGKHSSLGPTDPQIGGVAAHSLIHEFNTAAQQITADSGYIPLWQQVFSRMGPTVFTAAQHAIAWTNQMVEEWLTTGMFDGDPDAAQKAKAVVDNFGSQAVNHVHERHIPITRARDWGVNVVELEADQVLQELVLTIHHSSLQTLANCGISKLIENHNGVAFVQKMEIGT